MALKTWDKLIGDEVLLYLGIYTNLFGFVFRRPDGQIPFNMSHMMDAQKVAEAEELDINASIRKQGLLLILFTFFFCKLFN